MCTTVSSSATEASNPSFQFNEIEGVSVPREYIDPITGGIMLDPVIAVPSGHSFNRSTIEKIVSGQANHPLTREVIQSVIPNHGLKDSIERFLALHPDLKKKFEEETEIATIADYSLNTFASLLVEKDVMSIPANKTVRIVDPDAVLAWDLKQSKRIHSFIAILNSALFPFGLSPTLRPSEGKRLDLQINQDSENRVCFHNKEDFVIKAERNTLFIRIDLFFKRMISAGRFSLTIKPRQQLIFTNIPQADFVHLIDISVFHDYLANYVPESIDRCIFLCNHLRFIRLEDDHAFSLSNNRSEWTIRLIPKAWPY